MSALVTAERPHLPVPPVRAAPVPGIAAKRHR
jgi:hypothetical protein